MRKAFMTIFSTAALLALASVAFAATPLKLAMGWVPNVEHAGAWIALENGYYAAEGIDFSYSPGGPNAPDPLVVLESGKAQFASATKACDCSASPARIAVASSKATCTVGWPRRSASSSIAGRSSCTSE